MPETNDPRAQEEAAAKASDTAAFHARMEEAGQPILGCRSMFGRFMCNRPAEHPGQKHRAVVEWGDST